MQADWHALQPMQRRDVDQLRDFLLVVAAPTAASASTPNGG